MNSAERSDAEHGGDPACWAHLDGGDDERPGVVVADLGDDRLGTGGAVWSLPHGGDLDANLVRLAADTSIADHVNDELDVVMFVRSGAGVVVVDGDAHDVRADIVVHVPRGARRSIAAGPDGLAYLSVHRRRGRLGIG